MTGEHRSSEQDEVRFVEVVFPDHTNHYGTLFGGHAMGMMDRAAFVVASRRARTQVVTASADEITFHAPARRGDVVEVVARLISTGRSSMVVRAEMSREDLASGDRTKIASGRFTMVAVDRDGQPVQLPDE